jgi:hypothetical protein
VSIKVDAQVRRGWVGGVGTIVGDAVGYADEGGVPPALRCDDCAATAARSWCRSEDDGSVPDHVGWSLAEAWSRRRRSA